MDLLLGDDQRFFQETTRRFLDAEMPTTEVRRLAEVPDGFERRWWQQGADLGWTGLLVGAEGGEAGISGKGVADLAIVAEEFGRHIAPGPLFGTNLVVLALATAGGYAHADELASLVAGEQTAAWACLDEAAGWDPRASQARAEAAGVDFVLRGAKVATRLLFHERAAVGGSSPYLSVPGVRGGTPAEPLAHIARRVGRMDDPAILELLGEGEMLDAVREALVRRVATGLHTGHFPNTAASMTRLYSGLASARRATLALEVAGEEAVAGPIARDGRDVGVQFVQRQARRIGGGTTEMARNLISERMLGMAREPSPDRELPFNEVPRRRR